MIVCLGRLREGGGARRRSGRVAKLAASLASAARQGAFDALALSYTLQPVSGFRGYFPSSDGAEATKNAIPRKVTQLLR